MDEPNGNGIESRVEVDLRGLSIYTHHGVSDAEQEVGQRIEFDLSFDVPDCDAVLTDRIEDTVDYSEVCDIVALAATERSYSTLERLAQVSRPRLEQLLAKQPDAVAAGFARARFQHEATAAIQFLSPRDPERTRAVLEVLVNARQPMLNHFARMRLAVR